MGCDVCIGGGGWEPLDNCETDDGPCQEQEIKCDECGEDITVGQDCRRMEYDFDGHHHIHWSCAMPGSGKGV